MKDVTGEYAKMIEAFECDFVLTRDDNDLSDLQKNLQNKDGRILRDIELLEKLSYGIRYGKVKIMEVEKGEERQINIF